MVTTIISRRSTLKLILATGGLTLAYTRGVLGTEDKAEAYRQDGMTTPLVVIHRDNSATIYNPNPDIGQGSSTGMPMLIAEEMDLDWATVQVEQLPLKRHKNTKGDMVHTYMRQASGGSGTMRRSWRPLRHFGAQGRDMFLRAAARKWGVSAAGLVVRDSRVTNTATGASLTYADLLADVANLVPNKDIAPKKRSEYRLIGKPTGITAAHKIVTGTQVFGIDLTVEGMLHAVIARCPHFCGSVKSIDDTAARAVAGVLDVIKIDQGLKGSRLEWEIVAGVAVIAETFWAAKQARDLLLIEWNVGPFEGYSSAGAEIWSHKALESGEGFEIVEMAGVVRSEGDYDAAVAGAATTHSAQYTVRHVAHALMEPHSAIADVQADSVYMKLPCQHPFRVQNLAQNMTGVDIESITVDVARSGGGFGRRWEMDYPAEAIMLSQRLGKPVKVSWTREDELTQDRYRNANNFQMAGGVNAEGELVAMRQRQASGYPSLDADNVPPIVWPYEDLMGWHFQPGLVVNHLMQHKFIPSPVPRGPWRAPGSVNSAFAQMSFLDEMAHKAGVDPLEFNLLVLGRPRRLSDARDALDTGRMAECYRLAASKAGWGKPLPEGRGRGIAGCYSHLSYVVHVIEVSVEDGFLVVEKVTSAADCGLLVNPLSVKAQIEGSIHDGLSVALGQEITVVNAAVQQSNFDTYAMARIDRAPKEIDIHFIEGADSPTGMGEPAIPPFAPALMNAIFAATGKRIRRIPIGDQLEI